jgi:hypothetical protein
MAAQILSDPTAQQSVMNSLFTAFAGFTAFGAGIVAVLASGGAVQKMADRLASRAEQEYPGAGWCRRLDPIMIAVLATLVCLVVLGSGAGLLLSFLWLHGGGPGAWSWAYGASVDLFECEVASITMVTFVAVIATAVTSVTKARRATPSQDMTARGRYLDQPAGASPAPRSAEADRLPTREPRSRAARTRARKYAESGCTIGQTRPLAERSTPARGGPERQHSAA